MSVVILGAARTPIGRYGGTLRNTHPAERVEYLKEVMPRAMQEYRASQPK